MSDATAASLLLPRWLSILEDEPERVSNVPVLHHYTDPTGLCGIVSSNSLWANADEENSIHAELSLLVILEMTDWACGVKHHAFSEEREWRLICFPNFGREPTNIEAVSIRPTAELLVPYMVLRSIAKGRLPLVGVRCGPNRLQKESARAVEILLRKHGYADLTITRSETPIRV